MPCGIRKRHDEYFLAHSPFPVNIVIWLVLKPSVVFGHPATAENAMHHRHPSRSSARFRGCFATRNNLISHYSSLPNKKKTLAWECRL